MSIIKTYIVGASYNLHTTQSKSVLRELKESLHDNQLAILETKHRTYYIAKKGHIIKKMSICKP